jgi:perosamine synthetase
MPVSNKLWRVGKDELKYVRQAIESGLTNKMTHIFEESFAEKFGMKYAIAVNSGTSALHCAVAGLDIGPGDEVIVPPLTFAATGFAPLYVGAVPVFADVDKDTFLISADEIEKRITKRTRAIITVSLYGLTPDMDRIMAIAKKHNLKVIEDNAQCVFGRYKGKITGSIGDVSIFSLQRSKHLTTGDGGVILTNDEKTAEKMIKIGDLGYSTLKAKNDPNISFKEMIQNPTFQRHLLVGYNFRMPEVCAAMGIAQLEKLDRLVEKRIQAAGLYDQAIKEAKCGWLIPQKIPAGVEHSYWTYVMRLDTSKKKLAWADFRKIFLANGGEPYYSAWLLTYLEPALEGMEFPNNGIKYEKGLCPIAESLQPNLIQLKTNFKSRGNAKKQADILARTINYFNAR